MKKKFLLLLSITLMAFSMTGCLDDEEYDDEEYDEGYEEDLSGEKTEVTPEQNSSDADFKGLKMSVKGSTGEFSIARADIPLNGRTGDEDVWTIFVYLCGTDLESENSLGSGDLEEMIGADTGDAVRFIIQTGGCAEWRNSMVNDDRSQRFIVQDGDMTELDSFSQSAMGREDTLTDFLTWGVENYASEHMGLIFWNHGGGSITGVCFDENDDNDSLDLTELNNSLYAATRKNGRRFDFIGFDACLMGTVETANVLASYSDYMIGSEELEPGSGWDYTRIGNFIGKNPDIDTPSVGKEICDSFYDACEAEDDEYGVTLSLIDLSKMDTLLKDFNTFAMNMYETSADASVQGDIVRAVLEADNFGGNNRSEGYTNMVDMGGLVSACSEYVSGTQSVMQDIKDCVIYYRSGSQHTDASGLSMYYPLSIQGSQELAVFGKVCVSPYYLSFVDRLEKTGSTGNLDYSYDDDTWFDDDWWSWGFEDEDEQEYDDYWDYMDDYEAGGNSPFITFAREPGFDADGLYGFQLDEDGYYNTAAVSAFVYEMTPDGSEMIELGETSDVIVDWESGSVTDNFDGYWLSLPDGQNLATYIVEETDEAVIYTCPIMLNGYETNLRIRQSYDDGEVTIEGAWEGITDYGAAARDIVKLNPGDIITPLYTAYSMDSDDEYSYYGYEYKYTSDTAIVYDYMEVSDYLYSFCIDDIYGDYYITEPVMFNLDENGEVTFYE